MTTMNMKALLKHLGDPPVLGSARTGEDETDWIALTKEAISNEKIQILKQGHDTKTGVKPKTVTQKSLGNKAIMKEIASLREGVDLSLSSFNHRINQLEVKLMEERRQRRANSLLVSYCQELNPIDWKDFATWLHRESDRADIANDLVKVISELKSEEPE